MTPLNALRFVDLLLQLKKMPAQRIRNFDVKKQGSRFTELQLTLAKV